MTDERETSDQDIEPQSPPPTKEGDSDNYLIVGVGASAGGLEALRAFFGELKPGCGMAFVVVTHQHTERESLLPGLLDSATELTVVEVEEGIRPVPDHVYVTGSDGRVEMQDGVLSRGPDMEPGASHRIDHFLRSLAMDQGPRGVAVILSGAGSDGAVGIKEIKASGGMVMAQDPDSAKYASMPASTVNTGMTDFVQPPAELPGRLLEYAEKASSGLPKDREKADLLPAGSIEKILRHLKRHIGHDFRPYKRSTMSRRIERRMHVHRIERPDEYAEYLKEHPKEARALQRELLISVTRFFRDPEAWEALREHVLPDIVNRRQDGGKVRVWVAGCATGEEAYSIAILLKEVSRELDHPPEIQVFATDLDEDAIETARRGIYAEGIAEDVPDGLLDKYFSREDASYRISRDIRGSLTFATQNILSDPPFTRLDLVICRNFLIYLESNRQTDLVPTFHYALRSGGYLFLGNSESPSAMEKYFTVEDRQHKILKRQDDVEKVPPTLVAHHLTWTESETEPAEPAPKTASEPEGERLQQALLRRFAPTHVVVDEHDEIVFFCGRTGMYLELADGEPSNDLFAMAREGLGGALRSGLREARTERHELWKRDVSVRTNGDSAEVDLHFVPLRGLATSSGLMVAVSFLRKAEADSEEGAQPAATAVHDGTQDMDKAEVEAELARTRESLQATIEELQTSNEELQSSNEELQSTNEELQSTNEEMQTSKEELESMNEELSTVNSEQEARMEALGRANDDMKNLLNSIRVATIFLDEDLKVKRYTEEAQSTFRLIESDIGRPLSDLATDLEYDKLIENCRRVLQTLESHDTEVRDQGGTWYRLRIMPYRTSENVIDGVVITLTDITRAKEAEKSANASRDFFASIVETVRHPLLVLDPDLRISEVNDCFCRIFAVERGEAMGTLVYDLARKQWDIPELRELLEAILPEKKVMRDYRMEADLPGSGRQELLLNASRLEQEEGRPAMILLAIECATGESSA